MCYAAELVPEISDDIVNIDRAMRWGFAWAKGPFELIDEIGSDRIIDRLLSEERPIPKMLQTLLDSGSSKFYVQDGTKYLGINGRYYQTPEE